VRKLKLGKLREEVLQDDFNLDVIQLSAEANVDSGSQLQPADRPPSEPQKLRKRLSGRGVKVQDRSTTQRKAG
jgi:hypothetical protein